MNISSPYPIVSPVFDYPGNFCPLARVILTEGIYLMRMYHVSLITPLTYAWIISSLILFLLVVFYTIYCGISPLAFHVPLSIYNGDWLDFDLNEMFEMNNIKIFKCSSLPHNCSVLTDVGLFQHYSDVIIGAIAFQITSPRLFIPPFHRGCDLCASLVRPQNWSGRRWRQSGGRTVALVVQGWHRGRSDITMDAMVVVKFWACSKQSHKDRRGGRSLTGRSKEAGWRHTHRRGRRMGAQWSAIGRPVKNANIVYQFERHVCLPCTTTVPPLADQWRPLSDHCGDHCASIQRPRQHLSHNGNGFAFTLPSLCAMLCHYSSFGRSRKAQRSCCSSYTETELSGFRRPLSVLTIFMVAQRWHEGRSPV